MAEENLSTYFKSILEQDRAAVVICNLQHEIIYMNPAAVTNYAKWGGYSLIGKSLLDYMSTTPVDIAFLDIIMDDSDGISLAMEIKRMQPDCKIVFISSSRDFALEAFQVYASGYLLKPVTKDEIINVLNNII